MNKLFVFALMAVLILPTAGLQSVFAQTPDVRALDINSNRIIQINPNTGNVIGGFPSPDPGIAFVSGLTFAEGGSTLLFQNGDLPGNPANLYRLIPSTGAVLNTHSMIPAPSVRGGLSFEAGAGVAGADAIFAVLDGFGVDRQDGYNGPVSIHFGPMPFFPGALGGDDAGRHFVFSNGVIEEFNPLVPNAPALNAFPSPAAQLTGLAYDGTNLYASDTTTLYTLNPNNGAIITQVQVSGNVQLSGLAARLVTPVGGDIIPIDTTMVLLGATETTASWMIPVIIAAIGIGIVIARKF